MERLTIEYCGGYAPKELCSIDRLGGADDCDPCCEYCKATTKEYEDCGECAINKCFNKLGKYENLEEQGLLLRLPCKVGDTVYAHCSEFDILSYMVDSVVIDNKITYQCSAYSNPIGDCPSECLDEIEPDISDFGKTVFLTRKEAEAALEKMKEADNG